MKRILIVEDDKNLTSLYEIEFKQEGYEVITAQNGNEAIQKNKIFNPDLVILDLRLPDMNGFTVIGVLLETNKYLPIIINSAYFSYMDDFMSWAAKAYVVKCGDLTELKNKVAESVEH